MKFFNVSNLISSCFVYVLLGGILYSGISSLDAGTVKNKRTGERYIDLQEAIDAASRDDVLKLKGEFIGSFTIRKSLTLQGKDKKTTILDGGESAGVLTITSAESVELKNLTIQDGLSTNGAGILNFNSKLYLENVNIFRNKATQSGGGIATVLGSVYIEKSEIKDNITTGDGAGINNNGGIISIKNSTISGNVGTKVGNVGTKVGNVFKASFGGGIISGGFLPSSLVIIDSEIINNSASSGGGIYNSSNSKLIVHHSKIKENQASSRGGGLYNRGEAIFKHSEVTHNVADLGGGIYNQLPNILELHDPNILELHDTEVEHNTPDDIVQK